MDKRDRFLASIIGLAVGDCVGAAVEFSPPGTFEPVSDMRGGGPFDLKPGEWTDDTSMALCLAESIIASKGFDADDQMHRYIRWYKEGYLSSIGDCFDIGIATREALNQFLKTGEPYSGSTDPFKAGNGSIMRLAPVPLFWSNDMEKAIYYSGESSRTTHQAEEAIDACLYLGGLIAGAVNGFSKNYLLSNEFVTFVENKLGRLLSPRIKEVAEGSYRDRKPPHIRANGYVVHSLEAVLWAFYQTDDFKEGLLKVVNLGDDADTTGAIYGQLAGAYYGLSRIPVKWQEQLVQLELIKEIANKLYDLQLEIFSYSTQEN